MEINLNTVLKSVNNLCFRGEEKPVKVANKPTTPHRETVMPEHDNYKAVFAPSLNQPHTREIKKAFFVTSTNEDIPIEKSEDGSFVVNKETGTRIYYGKAAINFLNTTTNFDNDTQIIFPQKTSGVMIKDGKEIPLPEDSAVQITGGTKNTRIKLNKFSRSPVIYTSEKDYDWYERYDKNAEDQKIKDKYDELVYYASNVYNAKFTPNIMLTGNLKKDSYLKTLGINKWEAGNSLIDELYEKIDMLPENEQKEVILAKGIVDKLKDKKLITKDDNQYLRLKIRYNPSYQKKFLEENGFNEEEIKKLMPLLIRARQARIDSVYARENKAENYGAELVDKMKQAGLIVNNKKKTENIYWKNLFTSERELVEALCSAKDKNNEDLYFTTDEIKKITNAWKKENHQGYDMTGMKYIDEDLAVYNLNDRINNWTQEETNWATNSTALSSTKKGATSLGVSIVRYGNEGKIISMNELRMGEALHKHPNKPDLKQYEVYFVTQGQEVLDVKKDGVIKEIVLNAGDIAVIQPSVEHCVNVVRGKYEHVCAQIPSAFHHGFGLKQIVPDDEDSHSKFTRGEKAIKNTPYVDDYDD